MAPAHAPQSHFVRHGTPHPKDLKSRHTKFLKQKEHIDGHMIPRHKSDMVTSARSLFRVAKVDWFVGNCNGLFLEKKHAIANFQHFFTGWFQ